MTGIRDAGLHPWHSRLNHQHCALKRQDDLLMSFGNPIELAKHFHHPCEEGRQCRTLDLSMRFLRAWPCW
jgi:hypothetical protein